MRIEQNYPLLKHNTFNIDVKTRWFLEYENETDLENLLRDEYFFSQAFWHIGQGSNLLFLGDFNGVIVHSAIKGINIIKGDEEHVWLKVGAAEDWDGFVAHAVTNGWGGIENLSLIPGEVGASAFQNIGAYGAEASEYIEEVHTYFLETGEKRIFTNSECDYAYRDSFFKKEKNRGLYYITHVVYRLDKKPRYKLDYGNLRSRLEDRDINLQTVRQAVIDIRHEKLPDPKVLGNAGSFFKNPYVCMEHFSHLQKQYPAIPFYKVNEEVVKVPAAWLIDQAGLKGKTLGGAAVHEKQPLVIVNKGGATGEEIAMLAAEIQGVVMEKYGIELSPEVNYI